MGQFDFINRTYGTELKRGQLVKIDGRPGKITSAQGAHIMVRFDGLNHSRPCHPTWEVTNGGEGNGK